MNAEHAASADVPKDISWLALLFVAVGLAIAAFLFDLRVRPMKGVDPTELILWYVGYGPSFMLFPGLVILLVHLVKRRNGRGLARPKRTTAIAGCVLMAFVFFMTVLRLSGK